MCSVIAEANMRLIRMKYANRPKAYTHTDRTKNAAIQTNAVGPLFDLTDAAIKRTVKIGVEPPKSIKLYQSADPPIRDS